MRDETRVIANTLLTYGARAVAAVVGVLMVPYLLSRLGESQYGMIGIVTSIVLFVELIELGIRPAASRQFTYFLHAGETERSNELASTAMATYLVLAAAVLLILHLGAGGFLGLMQVDPELRPEGLDVLRVVALSLALRLINVPYEAALASQLRFDVTQYAEVASSLIRPLFIVVVFTLWEPRLLVWALAVLVSAGLAFLVHRWQAYVRCPSLRISPSSVSRRGLRDLAGFSASTSVLRLSDWLMQRSGPLVISFFLGTAAVAHYAPAMILVIALQPLAAAFLSQLTPVVTRWYGSREFGQIQRVLERGTRYALLVSGGAVVLMGSLSFALIPIWIGEGFRETSWVLLAWCAARLLQACTGGAYPIFVGTGRLRAMAVLSAVLAVLSVGASVYLVAETPLGIIGAAVAMLGAQLVRSVAYYGYSTRICNVNRAHYLRQSFAGPLLCLAALAASSIGLQLVMEVRSYLDLAVAAALPALLFAALAWTIGLNPEDRAKARTYAQLGWGSARALMQRRSTAPGD